MELFSNITRAIRRWTTPQEPNEGQLTRARSMVEAATAQIGTAFGAHGTAFNIRYRGEDYLITNAHVTNNYYHASRGFNFEGNNYFPIFKNGQMAFAEHLVFNPQGGPCSEVVGTFNANAPFRDLSILRVLSPEETRRIIVGLSYDRDDAWPALVRELRLTPRYRSMLTDNRLSAEELAALTQEFRLPPIPVSSNRELFREHRSPSAYSVAGHRPQASHVRGVTTANPFAAGTTIAFDFNQETPIVGGHSGSLLFDVNTSGRLTPLGVIVGASCTQASAVRFDEVIAGLDTLRAQREARDVNLVSLCRPGRNGAAIWADADNVTVTSAPIRRARATTCSR